MERSSSQAAVTEILINLAHAAEAVVQLYERDGPKADRILAQVEGLIHDVIEDLRPVEGESRPAEESLQLIDRAKAEATDRGWPETVAALDRLGVSLTRLRNRRR